MLSTAYSKALVWKTATSRTTHKTPWRTSINKPLSNSCPHAKTNDYRKIRGEVRYISDSTRPDITYATNRLAQHMKTPKQHQFHALKCLLRYIKGTRSYDLYFPRTLNPSSRPFTVHSDADFVNAKNRKSISEILHCITNTPIPLALSKQNIVALSPTEAEYISATDAARHSAWIQRIRNDLQPTNVHTPFHYIDNQSAILIEESQSATKRRKHIDKRYHYLQHQLAPNVMRIHRVPAQDMTADIFTKPLHRDRFRNRRTKLNVIPSPAWKWDTATGECQTPSFPAAPHFHISNSLTVENSI